MLLVLFLLCIDSFVTAVDMVFAVPLTPDDCVYDLRVASISSKMAMLRWKIKEPSIHLVEV